MRLLIAGLFAIGHCQYFSFQLLKHSGGIVSTGDSARIEIYPCRFPFAQVSIGGYFDGRHAGAEGGCRVRS